ncbi:hypothetical protein [Noviherbaspirillum galbum]|uniref:Uncharacterized protein n=1 Tax=Noviherbaspirillum galbum TaxID=2709383 RepID=A0A6B3SUM6_9BURK|nr:hypothetical protein [Noviherbaspirillum galbum]NEX64188.1 hypothetical protein [Noviherbaspirillum galbum]
MQIASFAIQVLADLFRRNGSAGPHDNEKCKREGDQNNDIATLAWRMQGQGRLFFNHRYDVMAARDYDPGTCRFITSGAGMRPEALANLRRTVE